MKKIIPILIVGLLVISGLGAVANNIDAEHIESIDSEKRTFTHAVLAEYGTATWCGYCHYAHTALRNIFASGDYPFYYVSYVCDKNPSACNPRIQTELNLYGYPTVYFDGGAEVYVGGGTGNENAYRQIIPSTGARAVYDVDITLTGTWLGGTTMSINATVTNYETSTYTGTIRVYITEIISSMNWKDTSGQLYTFPLLDYAFDADGTGEEVSIPAGGTWYGNTTWDGSAHGFSSITEGNIMLIASVFNDDWHQGYAYPQQQSYPFDAYYVDETVAFRYIANNPPNTPSDPSPANGAIDVGVTKDLSWTGGDPDWFDTVTYDVYFGTVNPPPLVSSGQEGTTYDTGTMDLEETYYWQIVSSDNNGASTTGPVWSFTIRGNDPPNIPSDPFPEDGATDVAIDVVLTWTGEDPDGDDVVYDVYFGTDSHPPLVSTGQSGDSYDPGDLELVTTYYWQIVSWDTFDESAASPVWSFTTRDNTAPEDLEIDGPTEGAAGEEYTYEVVAIDPEDDDIIYCFDFGDDTGEICIGPYESGDTVSIDHTWEEQGTYTVKVKATDIFGAESDWVSLEVVMPVYRPISNLQTFFQMFLERLLNAFPILKNLLGL